VAAVEGGENGMEWNLYCKRKSNTHVRLCTCCTVYLLSNSPSYQIDTSPQELRLMPSQTWENGLVILFTVWLFFIECWQKSPWQLFLTAWYEGNREKSMCKDLRHLPRIVILKWRFVDLFFISCTVTQTQQKKTRTGRERRSYTDGKRISREDYPFLLSS